jgi:hypothetical protein
MLLSGSEVEMKARRLLTTLVHVGLMATVAAGMIGAPSVRLLAERVGAGEPSLSESAQAWQESLSAADWATILNHIQEAESRSSLVPGPEVKLTASDAASLDRFGHSVAVSGDLVVVGAYFRSDTFNKSGAAYVFERNRDGADVWGEVKKLMASDGASGDCFGTSVSISGDTVVVGAPNDDWYTGSAYVFERNHDPGNPPLADNWGQVAKLTASDAISVSYFGTSVSISGDTVVVGAKHGDYSTHVQDTGSAYVFARNEDGADQWGQVAKLTASDYAVGDFFGDTVSVSGDTVVVGARQNQDAGLYTGSAYVYERNEGGVDNWGQVQKLLASDFSSYDRFGTSVSIDGDTIAVGATQATGGGGVYVFERNQGGVDNWGEVEKLTASDAVYGAWVGSSVSISGDTVVAGATGDDDNGSSSGATYVFERNRGGADNWGQVLKLTASDGAAEDVLGEDVSISGDTIIAGAAYDDDAGDQSGSAYVFGREGATWAERQKPKPDDADASNWFGQSVSVSGDTAVVGAPWDSDVYDESGSAYVFERNFDPSNPGTPLADNWGQVAKLNASDPGEDDYFGESVSVSGDTAVVGAWADDCPSTGDNCGAAYVFERNYDPGNPGTPLADNWGQVQKLTASDAAGQDHFGRSVAISGDTIVVGAPQDDDGGGQSGSAYVFERNYDPITPSTPLPDNWGEVAKIIALDDDANDYFGWSVSISGDTVVVGAPYNDDVYGGSGSAYVFARNKGGPDNWGQVKKMNANFPAANVFLGYSVSISGDTAVAGAYKDDDGGTESGSAYVFERNYDPLSTPLADNWEQVQKLTAGVATSYAHFGESVSISGDTVVVGAPSADNGNGVPAGSAYVFERNQGGGDNWGQMEKLTASDGASSDLFGCSVSVSGGKVVVGAYSDDDWGDKSGSAYVYQWSPLETYLPLALRSY